MKTSETINEIAIALIAVQAEIEPAIKDSTNPHFKSRYADLSSIWGSCRTSLAKNHLAVIQSPTFVDQRVVLITRVIHKSGQWIENELSIKPQQDTAQGIGSCITYARRYALASMVGVTVDEDDDGNEASKGSKPPQQSQKTKEPDTPKKDPVELFNKSNPSHLKKISEFVDTFAKAKEIPLFSNEQKLILVDLLHGSPFEKKEIVKILAEIQKTEEATGNI